MIQFHRLPYVCSYVHIRVSMIAQRYEFPHKIHFLAQPAVASAMEIRFNNLFALLLGPKYFNDNFEATDEDGGYDDETDGDY